MPEYPKGSGSIYPDNTTSSQINITVPQPTSTAIDSGGVYCSRCGHKMYHSEKSNVWRCPQCMD